MNSSLSQIKKVNIRKCTNTNVIKRGHNSSPHYSSGYNYCDELREALIDCERTRKKCITIKYLYHVLCTD